MRREQTRRIPRFTKRTLLDCLESRLLMAANMVVLGGFQAALTITDNAAPSSTNASDFGYDDISTTNPGINTALTHNFFVINQPTDGSVDLLTLTGNPVVTLTGDTTDFTLGDQPVTTSIEAFDGSSGNPPTISQFATFTVTFKPTTAGVHTASLVIPSSDPNHPNYTVNITGTGAAFTTLPSGTEFYSVSPGTGTPASSESNLSITYAGYTPDGVIFDSTANDGGTPLALTLGTGQVIAGWDKGLLGITNGENRVLLIPSDQAYGDAPTGGQPAGMLIFTVTANGVSGSIGSNFIPNLYKDILGRTADSTGLSYWNTQISQDGATPATIVSSFVNSTEYRDNTITALYQSVLDRAPDTAGLNYWLTYLSKGNSIEQMQSQFYGSPEFESQHGGTTSGAIAGLYQVLLQRSADTQGLDYWTSKVDGGETVSQVAFSIIRAPEGLSTSVENIYTVYLHRPADATGLAYWTNVLGAANASETNVLSGILSAAEFYTV